VPYDAARVPTRSRRRARVAPDGPPTYRDLDA